MTGILLRTLLTMLLLVAPVCSVTSVYAATSTQYTALAQKYYHVPSDKIMKTASSFADKCNEDSAIVLYTIVANRFSDKLPVKQKQACILAHVNLGKLYIICADYTKALDMAVEGVKLSERCGEKLYNSHLYNVIGSIYTYFLDYESAITYYNKAYEYCKKFPDKRIEYKILSNIANLYLNENHMKEARYYYNKTEAVRDKNDHLATFMSCYMKGLIDRKDGNYGKLVDRYKTLVAYSKAKRLPSKFTGYAYQEIYIAFDAMGKSDSTLKYMNVCYNWAKEKKVMFHFLSTVESLADYYDKKGDIKNAYKYKSIYINLMDSTKNTRQFDIAKNKLFLHEVDKTTKKIETLNEREQERLRTIRIQWVVLGAVLLLTIVIGVFFTVVRRQKSQLNASYHNLFIQNKENLDMQKKLEKLYKNTTTELEEKNRRIGELQNELREHSVTVVDKSGEDETAAKYHTSNLNEESQRAIERKILTVMEDSTEYCSTEFSLDRLAELVGSNSKYVSQVINASFKKNFNSFVNTYRIQTARERLIDIDKYGNLNIKGIAESVGFKSPTTFINVFKKMVGLTPAMYQNMARKDSEQQKM